MTTALGCPGSAGSLRVCPSSGAVMLPAERRLHNRADFSAVITDGRRGSSRSLVVYINRPTSAPRDQVNKARAGLIVSKAVGNAVTRNLLKRRLRELIRQHWTHAPEDSVVVRALPAAAQRSWDELSRDFAKAIMRTEGRSRA